MLWQMSGCAPRWQTRLLRRAEHFGIASEGAHDALADVRMCAALADGPAATG
ncbi:MAG: DNA polymerase III epsilon subunit-like protein [Rhodothermales bacterium]|jgi:DNA polymerase III epsilon subunit-like protein